MQMLQRFGLACVLGLGIGWYGTSYALDKETQQLEQDAMCQAMPWSCGKIERMPCLVAELIGLGVNIIVTVGMPAAAPAGSGSTGEAPPAGDAAGGPTAPIDLNTATLAELDTLPGVGPVLAQRILDWRTEHGRFATVDQLSDVPGIGDARLAQLRHLVQV